MTSLRELVETTRHALSGFGSSKEAVLELATTVNSSETSFVVDDVSPQFGAARGFIEIDLEMIRIKEIDSGAVALVAYGFGRGQLGTTAVSHTAGAEVRVNPTYPASTLVREINGVLSEIYPQVYAVKYHETEVPNTGGAIDVPDDATGIIAVYAADEQRSGEWLREDRWAWQPDSSATGKGLRVGGFHRTGLPLRIVYSAAPVQFDLSGSLTQDFTDVTGLPERYEDLIRLGIAARTAIYHDVARLSSTSAVPRFDGESRGPSGGANATRLLDAMYRRRIQEEAALLTLLHPIHLHFTGRV